MKILKITLRGFYSTGRWLLLVAMLWSLGPAQRVSAGDSILVLAAISTSDALQEIGRDFKRETGTPVDFSFAASSTLARQIQAGAPADVFVSADAARMEQLEKAGLVDKSEIVDLLSNALVVVVPQHSTATVKSAEDLANFGRIAIGDPQTVPVGTYAKHWLESARLWESLNPRLVPSLDARAALATVENGAVDAAIVYRTDAAVSHGLRVVYTVPADPKNPIVYPVAPIRASKQAATAGAFVKYLRGAIARAVWQRFGFVML